jgi:hypothetical protein
MSRLTLALLLLLLLLLPSGAAAKGMNAPVTVSWNGAPPADTPAGGTWHAAFTLVTGPGGYFPERAVHPVLLITGADGHTRHVAARADGTEGNAFVADVAFPKAGAFDVAVKGFDLRAPEKISSWGPVRIGPAAAPAAATSSGDDPARWPWVLAVVVLLGGLLVVGLGFRPRSGREARA